MNATEEKEKEEHIIIMKVCIKNWGFKIYHRFILSIRKKPLDFISGVFALFGGWFTLSEIEQSVLNTQVLLDVFREHKIIVPLFAVILMLFLRGKKLEHPEYLGDKDTIISLKIADILHIKDSAVVIPTNTTFDTIMDRSFISEKSIQGKFQKKFYGTDFSALDASIKQSLDECFPNCFEVLSDRKRTNTKRYKIGTVAKVTHHGQHYYFLAVADVSKSGKTENVTMENMTKALVGLWEYLSKEGHTEPITVPVIGTGRAGLKDGTFEDVVHETIFSFVTKSQDEFVSRKMTICIYPPSLSEANVTWERLCDYLDLQCHFFSENRKRLKASRVFGNVVE
ncbi:macro domain-containing protein [Mordavella massiliensis]|uniref:macro domain-containing protein n=1 Tax=Mordavella massiliensis TaxID=1871024 RepID=UPI00210BFA9C|nr:DUF6430 domain-containing protein [Mordavella massiliensis]